jgi:ethanolamine transporter EutH
MTTEGNDVIMAAVLDALTMVQGQLDTIAKSNARIEATHKDILHRLDTIDAGQAGVTDLVPVLETILGRLIEDRDVNRAGFAKTAEVAAFAYAAAMGNRMPLPVEVADDPLLERFMLLQPPIMSQRAAPWWNGGARSRAPARPSWSMS